MFSPKPVRTAQSQPFLQKLKELDLETIAYQLMQSGWTCEQTRCAIRRYKLFLSLVHLHPHTRLVPTQDIDRVWHCHILHTRKYRQDCQMLFGRFIDHEPDLPLCGEVDQLSLDTAFAKTQALLFQYFGEAALEDTEFEQLARSERAENLPQQQKFCEKGYLRLHRSACGRPENNLRETSQVSVS